MVTSNVNMSRNQTYHPVMKIWVVIKPVWTQCKSGVLLNINHHNEIGKDIESIAGQNVNTNADQKFMLSMNSVIY